MIRMLKAGVAGLSLISLLAFVPSCTRDTGQADDANTTDDAANTEVGAGGDAGLNGDVDNRPLSLAARLLDQDDMAAKHAAVVQVEVTGIRLIDPSAGHEMGGAYGTTSAEGTPTEGAAGTAEAVPDAATPDDDDDVEEVTPGADGMIATPAGAREGHVHYRLDAGPVIATPATRLSFHELTPGEHTVTVMLAAPDHTPLGPQETLTFVIPS